MALSTIPNVRETQTEKMTDILISGASFSVQMPAGTGKTHTIVDLALNLQDFVGAGLILTHTHAGVDALKKRARKANPAARLTIRTIDSWTFELIKAFPSMSGIEIDDHPEWTKAPTYYRGAAHLLKKQFIGKMLRTDYSFVLVDEYQDCSPAQHKLFTSLNTLVPTGVFGDPLQYLFDFREQADGERQIQWASDIEPHFPSLQLSLVPWRWSFQNPALGEWLLSVRENLTRRQPIDLSKAPITVIPLEHDDGKNLKHYQDCLRRLESLGDSVVVLHGHPQSCWDFANAASPSYVLLDPIYCDFVTNYAVLFQDSVRQQLLRNILDFVDKCARNVDEVFPIKLRLKLFRPSFSASSEDLMQSPILRKAVSVLTDGTLASIHSLLLALASNPKISMFRQDVFHEMTEGLRLAESPSDSRSLLDAIQALRGSKSHHGRSAHRLVISRPLLSKGLEYDHCVILDAERCSSEELYVSLTRGSKSVTIFSNHPSLSPKPSTLRPQRATQVLH